MLLLLLQAAAALVQAAAVLVRAHQQVRLGCRGLVSRQGSGQGASVSLLHRGQRVAKGVGQGSGFRKNEHWFPWHFPNSTNPSMYLALH